MPDRIFNEWNRAWTQGLARVGALGLLALALIACEAQPPSPSDGVTSRAQALSTGTVTLVNNPPTANGDSLTVAEDSNATVVDVLANDTAAPDTGETLSVESVTQPPSGGSVSLSGGEVSFTPAAHFFGTVSFTYTVSDGNSGTGTAMVTVTVTPENDPPSGMADTFSVAADSGPTTLDVLANDTALPDTGETLLITSVTQPPSGTVTFTNTHVSFTPAPGISGPVTFTYTLEDGSGGTDDVTVTVNVVAANNPPDAVDDPFTVAEDSAAMLLDVLANDTAAPDTGETLSITAVTQPTNGAVTFTATSVSFTPALNFNGTDTFTYTVSDGNGGTDTAMVTVTVTPVNDPPVALDDMLTVAENSTDTVVNVLANDTTAPDTGETLIVTAVTQPGIGTVTLMGGVVRYRPPANFTGRDQFEYTVSDGNGGTATATVMVPVVPSGTGGWNTTGAMATYRINHSATLLPSGKVLVTGGEGSDNSLVSAEVYDPATEAWSPTGAMATGRRDHTATLLPSGKVLVAGGHDSSGSWLTSAEVYDPDTGAWNPTSTMATIHARHTATLLPSGKVLVAGGGTASAEVYDPDTGAWSTTGAMNTDRIHHTATLLPSGKVLVAGGYNPSVAVSSAEVYDPDTGAWSTTGTMATNRVHHTATVLPSGKVLVTGGEGSSSLLSSAEVYDPATGSWSTTGAMTMGRFNHTATVLLSGKVLVTGGSDYSGFLSSAEVYDPATGSWSTTGAMTVDHAEHTATLLPSGQVLVTGGVSFTSAEVYREFTPPAAPVMGAPANGSTLSDSTPIYSGTADADSTVTVIVDGVAVGSTTAGPTGLWSLAPPSPLADGPHTVKASAANTGGASPDSNAHTFTVLRDPSTGGWNTTGALITARRNHSATVLPSGKVLVTGGEGSNGLLARAEEYDPAMGGWSTTGALVTARRNHSATVLPSGKVLVTGGEGSNGLLASAEVYDPATGGWSTAGTLATARTGHTATVLPSGEVLVTGGTDSSGALASAELFDPATGTWSPAGALATARTGHSATVLSSGKVLVTGGEGSSGPLASAELYDPATGTWSSTSSLTTARKNHSATVLLSGQVLITGGEGSSGLLTSTELYDPATGAWSTTGALATARTGHSAVLLPSGRVLITGSEGPGGALASTEVYAPSTGVWSPTGDLTTARTGHTATVLPSGHVLVTGGEGPEGPLASVEVYEAVGASRPAAPLPESRTDFMTVLLPNGLVLVVGGADSSGSPAGARLYNPVTGLWTEVANMLTPRSSATATLLPTGQVLVTGGRAVARGGLRAQSTNEGAVLASAELFDPETNSWRDTGSLLEARYSHSAILVSEGQVLVTGGLGANDTLCATAEVYDVATGTWLTTSPMNEPRRQHMVAQLPTGQVLVAGGLNDSNTRLSSAEVYDPVQRSWRATASMSTARIASTAVTLPTSQVMAVGGTNGSEVLSSAEVYEPVRGEWLPAQPLKMARKSHTALLLPTGRVLIMGGSNERNVLDGVEVYDTATDTWEELAPLTGPREDSMTLLLPTGQVMVLAGKDVIGPLKNTELYDEFGPPGTLRRPVVDHLPPQRPDTRLVVRGQGLKAPPGGSSKVRLQLAPRGALSDLPATEFSDTSVQTTLPDVPTGFHLLFVMVNDIAGGRVVHVDGTPPPAPAVRAFTNTPQPTLSGTAEPYSTIQVSLGGRVEGSAEADLTGHWSLALTSALPDGNYTASATAMDLVGNLSRLSEPFHFTVDTLAPAAPVVKPLGPFIKTPRPTLSGTAEPGSTVTVSLDGVVQGTVQADTEGLWSSTPSQVLEDGRHTASATATDLAGNMGPASTALTFTVDSRAPAAPEVWTPEVAAAMPPRALTIDGRAEPDSLVTVFMDGQVKGSVKAGSTGAWSLTLDTGLNTGEHTISATATDAAGNVSPPSEGRSFTVNLPTDGGCSGCAAGPGEPSLVLLGLVVLRRLLSRRRSTRA